LQQDDEQSRKSPQNGFRPKPQVTRNKPDQVNL
jgi:hypothetical protein